MGRTRVPLEELLRRFLEPADKTPSAKPPVLSWLVGQELIERDPQRAPLPLRPVGTQTSTTQRLRLDAFGFSYGDGYQGHWTLGWKQPWIVKRLGRVVKSEGWRPTMSWTMSKYISTNRYTECHHEHDFAIASQGPGLVAKLNETLDPELAKRFKNYSYCVTAGLAATFEDYLDAYFKRPETLRSVAQFEEMEREHRGD